MRQKRRMYNVDSRNLLADVGQEDTLREEHAMARYAAIVVGVLFASALCAGAESQPRVEGRIGVLVHQLEGAPQLTLAFPGERGDVR